MLGFFYYVRAFWHTFRKGKLGTSNTVPGYHDMQQIDSSSTALATITLLKPHQLTQAQFIAAATVVALENHGRKWNVSHGTYSSFSDAATSEAAVIDAHHGAVNNALYFNQPDAPVVHDKPSAPTQQVLADYPDLVAKFGVVLSEQLITLPAVNTDEFNALIASLRLLSAAMSGGLVKPNDGDIGDVLTDSGTHEGLNAEQIHNLCDRILFPS